MKSQTHGKIAAGVIAVVGLGLGIGVGIGIGAGIWSKAGTKPPQAEWFFAQQSSKARISKASGPSETVFVTLDGLSEEATAVTARPIFEAYTISHSLLAKLLSDDPGKNAMLVCGVGEENKVGVPLSLDYGTTSTDEDEMSWVGRLIPFSNETWGRADDDQALDASQIMTQFAEGEVVNLESCNLFIDSVDDLVNSVKWLGDKFVDGSRMAADFNLFTGILPSPMKDDAAAWLKEKKDTAIDNAVDGTRKTFEWDNEKKEWANPCAMLGNVGTSVLDNTGAFMTPEQKLQYAQSQGICNDAKGIADWNAGREGIDPTALF